MPRKRRYLGIVWFVNYALIIGMEGVWPHVIHRGLQLFPWENSMELNDFLQGNVKVGSLSMEDSSYEALRNSHASHSTQQFNSSVSTNATQRCHHVCRSGYLKDRVQPLLILPRRISSEVRTPTIIFQRACRAMANQPLLSSCSSTGRRRWCCLRN
jgi:hypothetical protein